MFHEAHVMCWAAHGWFEPTFSDAFGACVFPPAELMQFGNPSGASSLQHRVTCDPCAFDCPHQGFIPAGEDLAQGWATIAEAKRYSLRIRGCRGFCFEGHPSTAENARVFVFYKAKANCEGFGWTTYFVKPDI